MKPSVFYFVQFFSTFFETIIAVLILLSVSATAFLLMKYKRAWVWDVVDLSWIVGAAVAASLSLYALHLRHVETTVTRLFESVRTTNLDVILRATAIYKDTCGPAFYLRMTSQGLLDERAADPGLMTPFIEEFGSATFAHCFDVLAFERANYWFHHQYSFGTVINTQDLAPVTISPIFTDIYNRGHLQRDIELGERTIRAVPQDQPRRDQFEEYWDLMWDIQRINRDVMFLQQFDYDLNGLRILSGTYNTFAFAIMCLLLPLRLGKSIAGFRKSRASARGVAKVEA